MNRLASLLLFALVAAAPAALHAQLAVYGTGTGATFSNAPKSVGYGGTVGIYKQAGHALNTVSLGLDARGTFVGRDGFNFYTGAVGPRLAIKPHVIPLSPYLEGLVGIASFNGGSGTGSSTKFNYQIAGGLDATILPHLDWRVIDVAYSAVSSQSISAVNFSTGLVVRLW